MWFEENVNKWLWVFQELFQYKESKIKPYKIVPHFLYIKSKGINWLIPKNKRKGKGEMHYVIMTRGKWNWRRIVNGSSHCRAKGEKYTILQTDIWYSETKFLKNYNQTAQPCTKNKNVKGSGIRLGSGKDFLNEFIEEIYSVNLTFLNSEEGQIPDFHHYLRKENSKTKNRHTKETNKKHFTEILICILWSLQDPVD